MITPGRRRVRAEWTSISVRREPCGLKISEWATERGISKAEMIERMVKTYAALLGEEGKNVSGT